VTSLASRNDLVDVIVVDDRPTEQEDIRRLLKEECGCNAIFYKDYREAFKAVLEQVAHRLLVNFQLGGSGKNLGAALLHKLREGGLEVPTIVLNSRPEDRASVSTFCGSIAFARMIDADEIYNHVAVLKHTFRRPISFQRVPSGRPTVFVVHGRDVKAAEDGSEPAFARFIRILKVRLDIDAIVLMGEPVDGRTLIEQIEEYVGESAVVIALFTADDIGYLRGEKKRSPRARQNVIFETGFARGRLGPERTIIFQDRPLELPTDLGGVRTLNINETDEQIFLAIKQVFDKLKLSAPIKRI
jgi:predicted nucleotide-binding protein